MSFSCEANCLSLVDFYFAVLICARGRMGDYSMIPQQQKMKNKQQAFVPLNAIANIEHFLLFEISLVL